MKLFKVTTKKPITYRVIANDPTTAYNLVRKYLDDNDLCFVKERELHNITLIAEEGNYPNCGTILLIQATNYL